MAGAPDFMTFGLGVVQAAVADVLAAVELLPMQRRAPVVFSTDLATLQTALSITGEAGCLDYLCIYNAGAVDANQVRITCDGVVVLWGKTANNPTLYPVRGSWLTAAAQDGTVSMFAGAAAVIESNAGAISFPFTSSLLVEFCSGAAGTAVVLAMGIRRVAP